MKKHKLRLLLLASLAAIALSACGPEDGRARGGGAGADIGNTAANFKPKSKVFNTTP